MQNVLNLTDPAPLSVTSLVVNLLLCAMLSFGMQWHYKRFGRSLTNRAQLAHILPFLAMTTTLIISVVKSSLALSLGLVGALSIVRFRTPIKEPEELAYLFLAIAVGLGMGADQRIATIVAIPIIVVLITLLGLRGRRNRNHNLYLNIELPQHDRSDATFKDITEALSEHVEVADVRRLDVRDGMLEATFYIDCDSDQALLDVIDDLRRRFPDAALSFVDQTNVLAE